MLDPEFFGSRLLPALNEGIIFSLSLIVPSAILGFVGGVLLGVVRVFGYKPMQKIADAYVALFRGVPLLLQLFFLYNALPKWGISLNAYQASVLGFTLCSAAYHSEYIRGALLSIKRGQINAAYSLGFSTGKMVFTVVIPQALRRALPGCGNEIIYLIKYSSLANLISFIELTGQAKQLAHSSFRYTEVYLTVGLYYLAMTTVAALLLRYIEKKVYIPGFGTGNAG